MTTRPFLSLTASILAASSFLAGCDPGSDPDLTDGGGGSDCDRWYVDADGDNHGDASDEGVVSCTAVANRVRSNDDCDDTSAHVHPDQAELCDGIDNDCDGEIEDATVCPAGCSALAATSGPSLYMICGPSSWPQAEARCLDHGMHLVHVNNDAENRFVVDNVRARYPAGGWAWLGGSDTANEGAWLWVDDNQRFWTGGTVAQGGLAVPGVFESWRSNEPNNLSGGTEDCVGAALAGTDVYLWNDMGCTVSFPSICERD